MDREQWLKWRKIGSSDAPVIMGVSPWTTPYQLWMQKSTQTERTDNRAMRRGREMEEEARLCLEKMTGWLLIPINIESAQWGFMTASLDGYDESLNMIVEIKCPGEKDHAMAKTGKVPEKYFPQLQHQMACKETDIMVYFSYKTGADSAIIHVYRDDAYIKKMVKAEEEFWEQLLSQNPPNRVLKDEAYEEAPEAVRERYQMLKDAKKKREELEMQEEAIKKEIIHMANGKNLNFGDGKLYQSIVKGSVQYDQIPELAGVNLDQYRKEPSLRWTLR